VPLLPLEELQRIVELCRAVEAEGLNPFSLDIKQLLTTLRRYLPRWKRLDELLVDGEALHQLATVIRLQGEWLRHRASALYIDPLLVELKVRLTPDADLARLFLQSWQPVVWVDQIPRGKLVDAIEYWNARAPYGSQGGEGWAPVTPPELVDWEQLRGLKILSAEEFQQRLLGLWQELRERGNAAGRVDYWTFIDAATFEEAVLRAYLTSFLLSEGYAALEVDPIEDERWLVAHAAPEPGTAGRLPRSHVTALSYGHWQRRHSGEPHG
jgi:hypothetical protein